MKISDFGLSRSLGVGEEYYRSISLSVKQPIAWYSSLRARRNNLCLRCAPECVKLAKFTSASDVWAFGVLLWELFTYGFQPFAGLSGQQVSRATNGAALFKPCV